MGHDSQSEQPPKDELLFRPITEGLGFHPFSDGLPYAPITKSRQSNPLVNTEKKSFPLGATLAGAVRPVHNTLKGSPDLRKFASQVSVPVVKSAAHPQSSFPPNKDEEAQPEEEVEFGLSYVGRRIMAYAFDSVVSSILGTMFVGAIIWHQNTNLDLLLNFSVLTVIFGFLFIFNWVFTTLQEVLFKTSLGKRIFGLSLEGNALTIFLRAFFFLTSLGIFGMGLIWSLFDSRKCCLHDRLMGLQPTNSRRGV